MLAAASLRRRLTVALRWPRRHVLGWCVGPADPALARVVDRVVAIGSRIVAVGRDHLKRRVDELSDLQPPFVEGLRNGTCLALPEARANSSPGRTDVKRNACVCAAIPRLPGHRIGPSGTLQEGQRRLKLRQSPLIVEFRPHE
eukprot:3657360-Prymnesium_polylepis.3